MFDEENYKKTTIQFRNSKGDIVTLFDVPAFFQDAGMIVQEHKDGGYAVSGWQIDDGPFFDWESWATYSLSAGAGIKLFGSNRHRSLDIICGEDPTDYREDSCFIHGPLEKPRALKGTLEKPKDGAERYLELDLDACAREVNIASPSVKIAGHTKHAEDLLPHVDATLYDLEDLLCIINGQYFKSYKEFSEAFKEGLRWLYPGRSDLVRIDRLIFRVGNYVREYANMLPHWSYKLISRREHSGSHYVETCVGETPNWSFSDCDGIWYLGEEMVKTILDYKNLYINSYQQAGYSLMDAKRKAEEWLEEKVDKQFRHDMCLLSDFETPYSICTAFYNNSLSSPDGVVGVCQAQFMYTDFKPEEATEVLRNTVEEVGWTILPYTTLKETKCDPHAR